MQQNILEKLPQIKQNFTFTIRDTKTGKIKRIYKYHNLVVTVGRAIIAQRLAGDNTSSLNLDFGELGTGITAPDNGDTALETPVFRKATSSSTDAANQAFISYFFTAPEVSGTFKEFGTFVDGTISFGSGVLFSRVVIDITKTISETLTIDVTYTVT